MDRKLRRQFGLTLGTIVVALVLTALTWAAVYNQTRVDEQETLQSETARLANLVVAFEQYTIRTLETADTVIHYVIHDVGLGGTLELKHLTDALGINPEVFDAVSLIDRDGNVVERATIPRLQAPINLIDREHFRVHLEKDTGRVYVGKPVLSRRTQTMMMPVTRRVNAADGTFAGVVSVQFDPARFTEFYGTADKQTRDVLSLVGLDGITRVRYASTGVTSGQDARGGLIMTALLSRSSGTFVAPSRTDGVVRLHSYRVVEGYPLVATVSIAIDDILAAARDRAAWHWQGATAVTLVIAIAAGSLLLTLRRRRQIFEQLMASTRRMKALFEHSNDAIVLTDNDARILDVNPAACALLGYTRGEALHLGIRDVIAAWSEDAGLERWRAFLKTGRASGEYRLLRKDGSVVDAESSAVANIEPGVHLTVLRDVTERKTMERHSLRAQRMESLGTLAGGIAHDLNNALAPILLSISMLKDDEGDPERQEILDTIEKSAQRGADMVRQVLSFARGVEGQRVNVSIASLIRDVEKIVNDTFLKHIRVQVTAAPELWSVRGDPTQIHQVLVNLCVNARDAMPSGGSLTLSADNQELDAQFAGHHPEAVPGAYVCITVGDTGTGISADVLDRIFEPFYTTKAFGHGTGLGLSTSLAIIKSHGGFMRVQTGAASGTRFYVYLPAARDVSAVPGQSEARSVTRGHGQLVLVIDDEPAVREVTRRTLEAHGYRVLVAEDGVSGVELYAAHRLEVAAVITDMMMPLMAGPATIAALRDLNPAVRVIAASGLPEDARVDEAGGAGATLFLAKPFTAETLLSALQQTLGAR